MPTPVLMASSGDIEEVRRWGLEWARTAATRHTEMVKAQNEAARWGARVTLQNQQLDKLDVDLAAANAQIAALRATMTQVKEILT